MSNCPHISWALHMGAHYKLKTTVRIVLIALSEHANGSKVCWPSIAQLCYETGLCRRAVQLAIQELASDKDHPALITVENRVRQVSLFRILRENNDRSYREHHLVDGVSHTPSRGPSKPVPSIADNVSHAPTARDAPSQPEVRVHGSLFDGAPDAHGIPQGIPQGRKKEVELRSPSPRPMSRHAKVDVAEHPRFAEFYLAYPRHVGRKAASDAYHAAMAKGVDPDALLEAIRRQRFSEDWTMRPYPATWLNGERWTDQPEPPKAFDPSRLTGFAKAAWDLEQEIAAEPQQPARRDLALVAA